MVLEVGMDQENVEEESPTCVLQYIIFPPHTTSTSMEDSVSEDDLDTNSDSVTAPTEADGEVQIITEVRYWILIG